MVFGILSVVVITPGFSDNFAFSPTTFTLGNAVS
jgi:hypothetical protein